MPKKTDPILAIDPGLRDMGFAVLSGRRIVTAGVRSLRLLPRAKRAAEARRFVKELIRAHHPRVIVLESTYRHAQGPLRSLHRFARYLMRLARRRHIPVHSYAAQTVRKALVGDGWSPKKDLAAAIAVRYPALRVHLTQDRKWKERYWLNMFDAVGLALHHQTLPYKPPSRSRSSG